MPVIDQILSQLIPFWMTRGQRIQESQATQERMEVMKLQHKLISMNIKEKEQMLETLNQLPPNMKSAALLSPKIAGTLLMLTNRGQEPTAPAIRPPEEGQIPGMAAPQPSLPEQIAQGQLGGAGGILGDVLYKELGIGRSSEIVTTETLQHPQTGEYVRVPRTRSGEYRWELSQPAPPEYTSQEITMPSGAKGITLIDKLRGIQPGAIQGQFMPTMPGPTGMPIKESDLPLWVHPETLQSPPPGTTPDQATQQGYKRLTTQAKNQVDAMRGMNEVFIKLRDLMEEVFPPGGGIQERMRGGPSRWVGAKTQLSTEAAALDGFIRGTVAPIIRSLGEKGNLSETDVKRAIELMPQLTDSADTAWKKFNNLTTLFEKIQRSVIAGKKALSLQPGKSQKQYRIEKVE